MRGAVIAAAAALVIASPAAAATIVNGSFEQATAGNSPPTSRTQLPDNLAGWTYSSNGTGFEIWELSGTYDNAADGSRYISFGNNDAYGGELSQTIGVTPGVTYTISYDVAEQQGNDPSQDLRAVVDNAGTLISEDNANLTFNWASGAPLTFTAASDSVALTFLDATPAGMGANSNIALDAVNISGGVSGVPEPATWAVLILGLFGLGTMLRLSRSRVDRPVAPLLSIDGPRSANVSV